MSDDSVLRLRSIGKKCRRCGYDSLQGHAPGCFGTNGIKQATLNSEVEVKDIPSVTDGYYVAELIHPAHKAQRVVVQVRNNRFLGNETFDMCTMKDGLAGKYKLHGLIHLDVLDIEPMLNDIKVKDLTKVN